MLWSCPKLWDGGSCFILGGGTSLPREFGVPEDIIRDVMSGARHASAYSPYLSPIHDKHIIAINNAYRIGDWIDVAFFGDCSWYLVHKTPLHEFPGLKVTCCERFLNKPKHECGGIKCLAKDREKTRGIADNPSRVCWNNNSGAAAISLAAHFGVKRIVLLGFDMSLDEKGVSHWFGSHNRGKRSSPPFDRHLKGFPDIAADAARRGIEILNCSPISRITQFPKVSMKDLLNEGDHTGEVELTAVG